MTKAPSIMKKLVVSVLMVGNILFAFSYCYAVSDFNGDKKDDIVTFVRSTQIGNGEGDVFVAISTGSGFSGQGVKWHDWFCINKEIPAVGDFNGDSKDDIVTFIRNTQTGDGQGDVFVAISTGSGFSGQGVKWHDWFCINNEIPAVGDFNGDDKDDIITFLRNTQRGDARGDVYVALSTGSSFSQGVKWHDWFCINNEIPAVGDFNGDGKDDIVTFVRSTQIGNGEGDVFVAISTGSGFSGKGVKWHDWFCISNEIPAVGDFNGDGKDDIVTFVRDTQTGDGRGDVYVALSTGSSFSGKAVKWHDFFCIGNEIPAVGDFNGDGKDDIATFAHETQTGTVRGDVYAAISTGSAFSGKGVKWHDFFCINDEIPTTFAAVFPYYMFAISYEDNDKELVGYASDSEERFWDNVWDFIDEFASILWRCTQYYWGACRLLNQEHLYFIDSADIAYLSGHGRVSEIQLYNKQWCNLRLCSWGSWSSHSRRGDLEYVAFESCQTLSLGTHWRNRWKSTPNRTRPFSGLHVACGFRNNHWESPVFELSDEFAENLEDGMSVRWAWLEASDDEDDWVWGHDNIGCVMYIRPHKYEWCWQHNSRDRWYHDSDYLLDAEWWDYD